MEPRQSSVNIACILMPSVCIVFEGDCNAEQSLVDSHLMVYANQNDMHNRSEMLLNH
jgi:hypothetical protein